MIALKYQNEFIDLAPGQSLEFSRNNPLFILDDLLAEYSTPITINYSEKNVRLLGYNFFDITVKQKIRVDVELYDSLTYKHAATLIITNTTANRRVTAKSNISGFLLSGVSIFFNKVKHKKAQTLQLGGDRTFAFTTTVDTDGSTGYLQHFKATENGTYNYIIAPIRNEATDTGWMNAIDYAFGLPLDRVYIFPNVKYLLTEIFAEYGYTLDTTLLDGTNWEKLFLVSLHYIRFLEVTYTTSGIGYIPAFNYKSSITFKLSAFLSKELNISDVVLGLCKKYGWAIVPQVGNTMQLVPLKAANNTVKDFTKYAAAEVGNDYSEDGKIVAFKNSFPNSEQNSTSVDLEGYKIETAVIDRSNLPATTGNYDNSLVYVYNDNKWYKIDLDPNTNLRIWVEHANNIGNYEPLNNNTTIESNVSTLPMYYTDYRIVSGVHYYAYFALCNMDTAKEFGLRTLLYLGVVYDQLANGTTGSHQYPLLSSTRVANGTEVLPWSNTFTHPKGAVDYGIIKYWFADWLQKTSIACVEEQHLYLPLEELRQMQYSDVINLFNIPYLIKNYVEPVPYKGFIKAYLQRLAQAATDATLIGGAIYLKFAWENEQAAADHYAFGTLIWDNVKEAKPIVKAYSDAAGTIPLTVSGLEVLLSLVILDQAGTDVYSNILHYKFTMSGSEINVATITLTTDDSGGSNLPPTGTDYAFKQWHPVALAADVRYNDVRALRTSAGYNIIP